MKYFYLSIFRMRFEKLRLIVILHIKIWIMSIVSGFFNSFESKINSNSVTRTQIANQVSVTRNVTLHKSEALGMLYEWFLLI